MASMDFTGGAQSAESANSLDQQRAQPVEEHWEQFDPSLRYPFHQPDDSNPSRPPSPTVEPDDNDPSRSPHRSLETEDDDPVMANLYRSMPQGVPRPPGQQRRAAPLPTAGMPIQQDPAFWHQQQQQTLSQDAARRRAAKPTDLDLPEAVLATTGEIGQAYNSARVLEKRIDSLMTRKMLECQERVIANVKQRKRLRLYIWNDVENQPWQLEEEGRTLDYNDPPASYKVWIYGELLDPPKLSDPDDGEDDDDDEEKSKNPYYKIKPVEKLASTYFKSITVEYEKSKEFPAQYPTFSWNKPETPDPARMGKDVNFNRWSFKRDGDEMLQIKLHFLRDENPARYHLSGSLQWIVDEPDATKSEVIMRIMDYIRLNKLEDENDNRKFRCDWRLKEIFGKDEMEYHDLSQKITDSPSLAPLQTISFPFTIRVDKDYHSWPQQDKYMIVECNVWIDDPVRDYILAFTSNKMWSDHLKQILEIDEKLALIIQKSKAGAARLAFFKAHAEDPIAAQKRWLSSMGRDLEILMGESFALGPDGTLPEELRRGGEDSIWSSAKVEEAVNYMLSKPEAMEVVAKQTQRHN